MESIIKIEGLSKSYGSHLVLDGVDLEVPRGKIVGLLGANGCGKTTMMKILTGLIHDYSGSVLIDGHRPGAYSKSITSYLAERTFLPEWFRMTDAIDYYKDFYADFDSTKAVELTRRLGVDPHQRLKAMSKGQKERLQLVLVMSRKAQLYVMDEPLGGVDPAARAVILDIIMKNYSEQSTLLISTHLVHDLEQSFNHVLILGHGHVLYTGDIGEIKAQGLSVEEKYKEVYGDAWQID